MTQALYAVTNSPMLHVYVARAAANFAPFGQDKRMCPAPIEKASVLKMTITDCSLPEHQRSTSDICMRDCIRSSVQL